MSKAKLIKIKSNNCTCFWTKAIEFKKPSEPTPKKMKKRE